MMKKQKKIIKKNEKANDLLREATIMHELMAESLWKYKLRQKSTIVDSDSEGNKIFVHVIQNTCGLLEWRKKSPWITNNLF